MSLLRTDASEPIRACNEPIDESHRGAIVTLSDWLAHVPPDLVAQHLNVDAAAIARFPKGAPDVVPV